jgi:biopolymer transport protein ExbD
LLRRLTGLLAGKTRPEDRVVIVKSDKETPYQRWIEITGMIESAGGVITLRMDDERKVMLK